MAHALLAGVAAAGQTERVVLVVIDGLRYSEGLGNPSRTWVPEMSSLAQQGTIVQPFRNDGFTYTARAIPAIWCGAWTEIPSFSDPDCGGATNNYAELPTVFEYFRKGLSRPAEDCIYVLKNLCSWKASFDPSYGPDFWPIYHSEGSTDTEVFGEAKAVLAAQAPSFLLLYLADVDHAGHSGVWSGYTRAIAVADSLVGALWTTLQADSSYAGKTTMIVTNDHGRHDYNFSGHGDSCSGCRTIQLLAIGPDIKTGFVSTVPRAIPDITPTIGALLGFSTGQATGSAMTEIFQTPAGVGDDSGALADRGLRLQVCPNPVRQSAEVQFTLSKPGATIVGVHDLSGRLLATILDRELSAGEHSCRWDGRGMDGKLLASGIYFLTVSTSREVGRQQVILLP
jgi:hypothetical protein